MKHRIQGWSFLYSWWGSRRGDTLYTFEGAVAPPMLNYAPSMLMLHPQCVLLKVLYCRWIWHIVLGKVGQSSSPSLLRANLDVPTQICTPNVISKVTPMRSRARKTSSWMDGLGPTYSCWCFDNDGYTCNDTNLKNWQNRVPLLPWHERAFLSKQKIGQQMKSYKDKPININKLTKQMLQPIKHYLRDT